MKLQIYKDFIKSLEKVSDSSDEIFAFQSQIWKTCLKYKITAENTSKIILNNSGFRDLKLSRPNFYMDGKEVFNFAIKNVPKILRNICKFSKIKIKQLDYFVLHQANKMMLDKIFEELKIEKKKRLFSIEKFGNTSSASIPITLSFHKSKLSNKNVNILISGFGAGYSYASAILNFKQTKIFYTNFYG